MAVRFVYFDLGNVLVHFDPSVAVKQVAEVFGVSNAAVQTAMYDSGIEAQLERGEITEAEFYENLCGQLGSTPAIDEVLEAMSAMFTLNAEMVPVVAKLRGAQVPMGILSNTCAPHWNWILRQNYGLMRMVGSHASLSYEIGCMKPDQKIYDVSAETAGVEASEILFVDDREENVAAAKSLGWQAYLFRGASQFVADLHSSGLRCFV